MDFRLILPATAFLSVLLAAATPAATAASALPAAESQAVERDGVAVTVVLTKSKFSTNEQPEFIVRFRNVGKEQYRNLYEVNAYWKWTIELTDIDEHAASPGPWRLHMNSIPMRVPLEHRQIKPGETSDVKVNLNDPPFTFDFAYAGHAGREIAPLRHLKPGQYRLTAKVALTDPFGPGYFEWNGPVTSAGIDLTITEAPPRKVTQEEQEAYSDATAGVIDKLDPEGLWQNGGFPKIDLPKDAKPEDVIDAAVNRTSLESKAYRVLRVTTFSRKRMNGKISGTAALLQVGKSYKVVIFFPTEATGWWSRFYDAEMAAPPTSRPPPVERRN